MPDPDPLAEADAPALEIEGLGHRYGDAAVLAGVDLSVAPGAFVAVLGPSGCGKTTLLRAVAGLLTPSEGTIRIGGVEVAAGGRLKVPVERRRAGLVFQDYALFPALTALENVAFGIPGRSERAAALMELVGLAGLEARYPAQLSGGQQQRVALARALAPEPALLLLDEPFANVDAERRGALGRELRRILAAEGAAAMMVTHDRSAALSMADQLVVLAPGAGGPARLAQVGAPAEVYRRPADLDVARLTGPASTLQGLARGDRAETPAGDLGLASEADGLVTLLLRPEQVRVHPGPGPLVVRARAFMGRGWRLTLGYDHPAGASGELLADADEALEVGASCRVEIEGAWALG